MVGIVKELLESLNGVGSMIVAGVAFALVAAAVILVAKIAFFALLLHLARYFS